MLLSDSHSDGTHSLQRICWRASDVILHFSKSVPIKKQTHLHLGWPEVRTFVTNFQFWVNYSFKYTVDPKCTWTRIPYLMNGCHYITQQQNMYVKNNTCKGYCLKQRHHVLTVKQYISSFIHLINIILTPAVIITNMSQKREVNREKMFGKQMHQMAADSGPLSSYHLKQAHTVCSATQGQ